MANKLYTSFIGLTVNEKNLLCQKGYTKVICEDLTSLKIFLKYAQKEVYI